MSSSIPKEPRQIMINLMYLVLTALLALNVSNEILNAFKTLSVSIDKSNKSIDQKNTEVYNSIKENEGAAGQYDKVHPYRLKADAVVKEAEDMVNFLNVWKKRITIEAGGYTTDPEDTAMHIPGRMDNIDATTKLLVEMKGGDTMKERIIHMREFLLSQLTRQDTASLSPLMPLRIIHARKNDHNPTGDWSIENFEHMPAIAAIALFSKFQNDVRSSEALVLNRLFEEAHAKDIKFDTIGAVAVPKTSYALEGDKIEASILLAAFNKAQRPTVIMMGGGGSTKPAVNGVVPWETIAKGVGLQTVRGRIELQTETGPVSREWKFEYMVGTTGASMQLDKMNVFYIGVDNPVTVAAAGYSVEDVSLSMPVGNISPGESKGHYIINKLDKPGTVEVAINAKTKEGPIKKVGGMTVRVKRIPNPVASLNNQSSGGMSASLFRALIGPAAKLDNFEFDAKFTIISFSYSSLPKGHDYIGPFPVNNRGGCRFSDNPQIVKAMLQAKAGDKIFIDDIKAVGPDNQPRNLSPIFLTLN